MNKDLFSLREEEIFRSLEALQKEEFVIIGGYAVNAYALPRFSIDCDIVVKDEKAIDKIQEILEKRCYQKEKISKEIHYAGKFLRYEKILQKYFRVNIDIMIYSVIDRMTRSSFSAEWIFQHSRIRVLKGKTIHEELRLKIIDLDALLVMKIISCRTTDIRDIFMMLPYAKNKTWIQSEIQLRFSFEERMTKILEKVHSKQFRDGLAGVYGKFEQNVFEKHLKAVSSFLDNGKDFMSL